MADKVIWAHILYNLEMSAEYVLIDDLQKWSEDPKQSFASYYIDVIKRKKILNQYKNQGLGRECQKQSKKVSIINGIGNIHGWATSGNDQHLNTYILR